MIPITVLLYVTQFYITIAKYLIELYGNYFLTHIRIFLYFKIGSSMYKG